MSGLIHNMKNGKSFFKINYLGLSSLSYFYLRVRVFFTFNHNIQLKPMTLTFPHRCTVMRHSPHNHTEASRQLVTWCQPHFMNAVHGLWNSAGVNMRRYLSCSWYFSLTSSSTSLFGPSPPIRKCRSGCLWQSSGMIPPSRSIPEENIGLWTCSMMQWLWKANRSFYTTS